MQQKLDEILFLLYLTVTFCWLFELFNLSVITGGYCLPSNLGLDDRYVPSSRDNVVKFDAASGDASEKLEIESQFFKDNIKHAAYFCYVRIFLGGFQLLFYLKVKQNIETIQRFFVGCKNAKDGVMVRIF